MPARRSAGIRMATCAAATLAVVLARAACADDVALPHPVPANVTPNIVVNGGFGEDLAGWEIIGAAAAAPVWSTFDIDAAPDSGSALLTNVTPGAESRLFLLRQCVALTRAGAYRLRASGYIVPGGDAGSLIVSYWLRYQTPGAAACSGGAHIPGGFALSAVGAWQQGEVAGWLAAPAPVPGDATLEIQLAIQRQAAKGIIAGHFDAIEVVPFETVFEDGFDPHKDP
jgi:hypothetical protein